MTHKKPVPEPRSSTTSIVPRTLSSFPARALSQHLLEAAQNLAETYLNAHERTEQRRIALRAYIARLESLGRRHQQVHETVRMSIAIAAKLFEIGQAEVALELLARISPAVSASMLSPAIDGRQ